ncbi:MAG: PE-PPE domain-containing protein, partial [Mycobacterium sp.]
MAGGTVKLPGHRAAHLYGIFGVITVAAGLVAASPSQSALSGQQMINVRLTNDNASSPLGDGIALIMGPSGIPTPGQSYIDAVEQVYLDPNGFTGQAVALTTPELTCCTDTGLGEDATDLVNAVNAQMATGDVSSANPIVVFGYSQSTAAASLAMEELHDQAVPVPADDLHFVLVGDSASADGGMLNTILPSLPDWLSNLIKPLLPSFDLSQSIGLTTPDYYQADVY